MRERKAKPYLSLKTVNLFISGLLLFIFGLLNRFRQIVDSFLQLEIIFN